MNIFNVFFPHVTYILGAIICLFLFIFPVSLLGGVLSVFIFHRAAAHRDKKVEPPVIMGLNKDRMMKLFSILFMLIILFAYTWGFLFFADGWLRVKPSKSWESDIKNVDTVIILGFGYEEDDTGRMKAGKSNEFLLDWTLKNSNAAVLLVQEGVWAAAAAGMAGSDQYYTGESAGSINELRASPPGGDRRLERWGRKFYRIHRDDKKVYVNTLQAAFCAMQLMEQLGKTKALIVAHDLQLERAAWDFEKLKKSRDRWRNFEFIVPKIPGTPFPEKSSQLHTRCGFIYKFVELFLSRARDFFSSAPETCIVPVH